MQRAAQWWGKVTQTNNWNCEKLLSIYVFVLQCPPLYPVLSTSWPCSSPTLIKLFLTKSGSIFCKLVTCWHLRVGPKSYYFAWKLMASTLIISLFYWTLLLWVMKWTKIYFFSADYEVWNLWLVAGGGVIWISAATH